MPLPSQKYGALQCSARSKRSGVRCLNNAVSTSNVCRMHGYVPKDKVKRGEVHGMYRNGNRTLVAQKQFSEQSARLQMIEDALHLLGMTRASRLRGAKAKSYKKLTSLEEIKKLI